MPRDVEPQRKPIALDEMPEEYRLALKDAMMAKARIEDLDEERRRTRSRIIKGLSVPLGKAEHIAMASDAYGQACQALSEARKDYADKESYVRAIEIQWDSWRTASANQREQMKRLG
jgi:ParB-like chromosome segregation protein Spo0J